jgi:putative transcriptional regulator
MLRAERSWSQAELGARLGVSRQTINAIETGRAEPGLSLAFRMARAFGRSVEGLFEPDEDFTQGDGAR